MSIEISFSCLSLRLGSFGREVSTLDFCLLANGFNQIHNKIVYLI